MTSPITLPCAACALSVTVTTIHPGPAVTGNVSGYKILSASGVLLLESTEDCFSDLSSWLFKSPHPIEARTSPPASCTTGSEIPKKVSNAAPISSITRRKMIVVIATFRASLANSSAGTPPTIPKKMKAEPIGLTTGSSALKVSANSRKNKFILVALLACATALKETSQHHGDTLQLVNDGCVVGNWF